MEDVSILVYSQSEIERQGYILVLRNANFRFVYESKQNLSVAFQMSYIRPDILLVDVDHTDHTLPDLLNGLKRQFPKVQHLALYSNPFERLACDLAICGVCGIVNKLVTINDFIEAVHAVARGCTWLSPSVTNKISLSSRDSEHGLTPRELDILRLLTQGKTNLEIASEIHIAERTLRYNLQKIYEKIQVDSRCQAISWMIQHGYTR